MSEKPQLDSDVSEENVSRETSETPELTPEQKMLNDIMDRAMAKSQAKLKEKKAETSPQEETPSPEKEDAPPPPPEKNKPSSAYVYLAVLFGAAFLMLLLAYFVQQRNNDAVLDDLRSTTASREELLEDIKALEEERDQLKKEVEYQKGRVTERYEEAERLQQSLEEVNKNLMNKDILYTTQQYFWYIDQFMKNKDYPMAASAVLFGADFYRALWDSTSINPAQVEQYEAYRQELIDRGYLQQLDEPLGGGTDIWFTDKWDPGQHEDMAALCTLWCALDEHFVKGNDHAASQYLSLNPLGDPASGYQERVERLASDFTLEQFQLMKDELVESKWLTIAEDGSMGEGFGPTDCKTDILYNLPFELPEN